ncbi:MAG: ribulokinase [Ruminococcaceae bacterium]|nr:ribulokinase [Oscillospiraceae bacterium]
MKKYTVGIDFGTLSGRTVLMDAESGEIVASSVCEYKHGVIDERLPSGKLLPLNTALQNAEDYIDVLRITIKDVMEKAGVRSDSIKGIGIDFTGCTMLPVDEDMRPLMFEPKFKDEYHAYVKLWKHNSCQSEGSRITDVAESRGEEWLTRYGGRTSSGWMFAKILQVLNEAPEVYRAAKKFVHSADWITYILTGEETHSAPFAGFKCLWSEEEGFPSKEFFQEVNPEMANVIEEKLPDRVVGAGKTVGYISKEAAALTGLCEGTPVATPALDAHASMPALGITETGTLMIILGTSSVQLVHSKEKINVRGICGYMKDAIFDGMYSYEASQACCGDHLDWFVKNCVPYEYKADAEKQGINIHKYLRSKAENLEVGESGLLALDWNNGNRSILADSSLTGAVFGLTLRSKPEEIYRALIEAAAFGAKRIVDAFEESGIKIDRVVASGGIAEKDSMTVGIYADVLDRPITVPDAPMSAAKGSAIYGAVAAGIYENAEIAANKLGIKSGKTYEPKAENVRVYGKLYREYCILHDYFGRGENDLLKKLRSIKD